jgi:hypothetical protein
MAIDINIPIEDSVTDGSLNPVTSNAVFDGLALKANSADLATVATTGDYNDLDNLPSIPAAQVNADWNATSGVAEILNKPTIPSVTGFVPYTGATNDVNLGVHDLTATQGTFATSGNPDTLTVNHSSGSGKALTITKGGNGEGVYVNKTSGSGNAVTVVGDLEATNLKRTGGTSSQFLKANGSIDSTSYQPTLGFTPENAANKQNSLAIDGTGVKFPTVDALNSYGITVDLIDALTVDFALGYAYKINSVTNVTNAPTTTILDDGLAYVLGATIAANSVMTVSVSTAARVQLNVQRV